MRKVAKSSFFRLKLLWFHFPFTHLYLTYQGGKRRCVLSTRIEGGKKRVVELSEDETSCRMFWSDKTQNWQFVLPVCFINVNTLNTCLICISCCFLFLKHLSFLPFTPIPYLSQKETNKKPPSIPDSQPRKHLALSAAISMHGVTNTNLPVETVLWRVDHDAHKY